MILRQKPEHPELFYVVDIGKHLYFSSLGLSATYMWRGKFYYKKVEEVTRVLEQNNDR